MIRARLFERGVTLIEVMITIAIVAIAFGLGAPSYSEWVQNTQIRTAAESTLAGIQLARAEGLKRNANALFQLVTSMDASCTLSTAGSNWVVSVNDASGKCDVTSSSVDPFITRRKASSEGTKNVTFLASASSIGFNGLGQVTPTPVSNIIIDIKNPTGGTCAPSGKMRCLQLQVTAAGQVRMCDPAVITSGDPRKC
jgi:type IV fimbrial biogenesis protein FimT